MCTQRSRHFHFVTCLYCTRCSGSHAVTQTTTLRVLSSVVWFFFFPSLTTVSPGFSDHVPAPRGNNLPHYLFLREQHGTSGNSGHVSPWCSRRADRGEDVGENEMLWMDRWEKGKKDGWLGAWVECLEFKSSAVHLVLTLRTLYRVSYGYSAC